MTYQINGKNIRINDDYLQKLQNTLGLTKEQAIQMYLEDEGHLINKEQEALELAGKENHITAKIHKAKATPTPTVKKTQKERVQKTDNIKETLVAQLAEFLKDKAENIEVVNKSKLVTFTLNGQKFKLDLIRTTK